MAWFKKPLRKNIIITIAISLIVFGGSGYWIGYSTGYTNGNVVGWDKGIKYGENVGYEKGYSLGYDNGKEFVVTHLDQYVTIPKAVSYEEVVEFLEMDKTDEIKYVDDVFDCVSYAKQVRDNANAKGIKCGVVILDLHNDTEIMGHAINVFDTNDSGLVFVSPQTDKDVGDLMVGSYYKMDLLYRITKVDIIW
ncbi:MAG: hypothetical protein WC169_09940 [Dehalococcoidia bacterium]|jgi:hypothetical protein